MSTRPVIEMRWRTVTSSDDSTYLVGLDDAWRSDFFQQHFLRTFWKTYLKT